MLATTAVALVLSGCSSGEEESAESDRRDDTEETTASTTAPADSTTTSQAPEGSDPDAPGCAELEEIVQFQRQLSQEIGDGSNFPKVQATFRKNRDAIAEAYKAAAAANPDLADAVDAASEQTMSAIDAVISSPDMSTAQQTIVALPAERSAAAVAELNTFTTSTCGFSFSQ